MKELNIKLNTFIHGNFISLKVCDDLINIFNKNKQKQIPGGFTKDEKYIVDKEWKDSMDLNIDPQDNNLINYKNELSKVLKNYNLILEKDGQVVAEHILNDLPLSEYERIWKNQMGKIMKNSQRSLAVGSLLFRSPDFLVNLAFNRITKRLLWRAVTCRAKFGII